MNRAQVIKLSQKLAIITEPICTACAKKDEHCCGGCADNNGYLTTTKYGGEIPYNSKLDLNQLKKDFKFDDKKGFLGPKGCNLPREKRSSLCLIYYFSKTDIRNTLGKENRAKISLGYRVVENERQRIEPLINARNKHKDLMERAFGDSTWWMMPMAKCFT